jgi:hypothetical protein
MTESIFDTDVFTPIDPSQTAEHEARGPRKRGAVWLLVPSHIVQSAVAVAITGTLAYGAIRPATSMSDSAQWVVNTENARQTRVLRMTDEMKRHAAIASTVFVRAPDGGEEDDDPDYGW